MSTTLSRAEQAWQLLEGLSDPEIPVITLRELGILREVRESADGLEVVITPTYSGCPAMGQIEDDVKATLTNAGLQARVVTQLAPAWTTDWMTDAARDKLRAYGIAPPGPAEGAALEPGTSVLRFVPRAPQPLACPRCGSRQTERLSAFGSTACKALWRCRACREPFEHFKPI